MIGPVFLTLVEVLEIHQLEVERYGGDAGLRDMGLLESALAMPQAVFGGQFLHPDLFSMAAAYAYHICQNHPFVDGNKRTALGSALVFLDMNGYTLPDRKLHLFELMMNVAAGKVQKEELAQNLKDLAKKLS